MIDQDTLTNKARTIFRELRLHNLEYSGKTICCMNFLIPLYLSEFIKQEENHRHILLVSWRYSTFLEPILSGNNPTELGKGNRESSICKRGGVAVMKDNSLNILERSMELANEKLECARNPLVFAVVPASIVLLKRIRGIEGQLPSNLILIVHDNLSASDSVRNGYDRWHLTIAKGDDSCFLGDVIQNIKDRLSSKPQLVMVDTPWQQIII
ncbi:hypothetical protein [Desertivirga brevis]|uniref:hypothetical protein n=1 Tax=Desertivirga brevis TaxID=2810310 RepID=UPI001A966D71|nr:hypothetical protein [Pedobacter sp. SYSU D00873]